MNILKYNEHNQDYVKDEDKDKFHQEIDGNVFDTVIKIPYKKDFSKLKYETDQYIITIINKHITDTNINININNNINNNKQLFTDESIKEDKGLYYVYIDNNIMSNGFCEYDQAYKYLLQYRQSHSLTS